MGSVWLATDLTLDRKVAMKRAHATHTEDCDTTTVQVEADLATKVRHPAPALPGHGYSGIRARHALRVDRDRRTVLFGRNKPDVHVCVGADDQRVSRQHGTLTWLGAQWWVSNTGQLPIRLPGSRLLFGDERPQPLAWREVGNKLNENLITELMLSTTLVPPHLALLDR